MASTFSLDTASGQFVHIALFENVVNSASILKDVIAGRCNAALVNPKMVVGTRQVQAAACKAAHCAASNSMKTRSIHTELLYWLSPTTSISNSLKKFGLTDNDTVLLVAVIDDQQDTSKADSVFKLVEGSLTPLSRLADLSDTMAAEKYFQISAKELSFSSLEDSIITRAMAKEAV